MKLIMIVLLMVIIYNCFLIRKRLIKKKEKKIKISNEIKEIINIGSSHSECAFKSLIDKKYYLNLADNSQTLYYDYIKLQKLRSYMVNKKTKVFLSISYFSFEGREVWKEEEKVSHYEKLDYKDFRGIEKFRYVFYTYFPIYRFIKRKIIKYLKLKKGKKSLNYEKRIKGHKLMLERNENLKYNLNLLKKIHNYCKELDIELILLTTPFMEEYNSYFSKELLEKNFYGPIKNFIEENGIKYLDFSHKYNYFKNKDFLDWDHLSKKGSIKFIDLLLRENKRLEEKNEENKCFNDNL